ncbi:DUF6053 domain-containing protein [Lysobacter enzymogenes]|uniref:DUF6053 domain-containing protein n=1 Tax=Lysobacter enzymogenes TaxID=69 RepID=UPI003747FAE2
MATAAKGIGPEGPPTRAQQAGVRGILVGERSGPARSARRPRPPIRASIMAPAPRPAAARLRSLRTP